MAAKKEKKPKKPSTKKSGGFWSRFGLQAALILVLGLAALSFITLGLIKRGSVEDEPPPAPVATTFSGKLSTPATAQPAPSEPAGMQGGFPSPTDTSAAAAVQPAQEASTASSNPFPPPAAGSEPTFPAVVNEPVKTAQQSFPQPRQTPAKEDAAPELKDQPPFPPPLDQAEKRLEAGLNIPEPVWQSVDEKWDKVKKESGDKDQNLNPTGASWKQLDVGQAEQATASKSRVAPLIAPVVKKKEPVKKPVSKTAKKPTPVKKSRPVARKSPTPLRLSIINESGLPEASGAYSQVLQRIGYQVKNVETRPIQTGATLILYKKEKKAQAITLYNRLPGEKKLLPLTASSPYDVIIQVRSTVKTAQAESE